MALAPINTTALPETLPSYGDAEYWFELIDENEAAKFDGVSPRTMQDRRQRGDGPPFVRMSSRCVKYRRFDQKTHADSKLRKSTSDTGQEAA